MSHLSKQERLGLEDLFCAIEHQRYLKSRLKFLLRTLKVRLPFKPAVKSKG